MIRKYHPKHNSDFFLIYPGLYILEDISKFIDLFRNIHFKK